MLTIWTNRLFSLKGKKSGMLEMTLKTSLDTLTMEAAVLGGAILGNGGGGKLEDGLYLGELATAQGGAALLDPGGLPAQTAAAAVLSFYSSGYDTHQIHPRQVHRAVTMLQENLDSKVLGLANAGMGAVDSIIGWELSAFMGIPLLNMGIPPLYHPATLRNLLLFWQETAAQMHFSVILVGPANSSHEPSEHLWHGRPSDLLDKLDALPAVGEDSYAVAAGPLQPGEGIPSQVNKLLRMGHAMLTANENGGEATVTTLQKMLPYRFSVLATVTDINWHGQGQESYGIIELRDINNRRLQLTYGQRYRELSVDGRLTALFPDLIITLGILGTPLTGEEVFIGQDLYLMTVPHQ